MLQAWPWKGPNEKRVGRDSQTSSGQDSFLVQIEPRTQKVTVVAQWMKQGCPWIRIKEGGTTTAPWRLPPLCWWGWDKLPAHKRSAMGQMQRTVPLGEPLLVTAGQHAAGNCLLRISSPDLSRTAILLTGLSQQKGYSSAVQRAWAAEAFSLGRLLNCRWLAEGQWKGISFQFHHMHTFWC